MVEEKYRILVLDDDELWLTTIRIILEFDYDLDLTLVSSEAVELLKANHYSLVILDQRLRGISGLEVFTKMQEIVPGLRAIVLTGYADVDSAVDSMKRGALDYISKGTKNLTEELRARVREALERAIPANAAGEQTITSLIARGENSELEFKASARWDAKANKVNKELERVIIKTVAAFLNSEADGTLLIGVDDAGAIVGLHDDYQTLGKKKDRDGYENFLTNVLLDAYGKETSPFIRITFHEIDSKDICRVAVRPSPKPVFVADDRGEHFFLRAGNSTRPLSTREALEYCKNRWK